MYSDKKKKRWPFWIGMAAAVLTAVIFGSRAICVSGPELEAESAAALKAAIESRALQCYVVEGMYPPALSYLEENYGLQVNTEDYYVIYNAFASNLPPNVQVTGKR
ncbi:MAG: hypothetical protein HFI93_07630 [Lachnospiraceae bacterium]|nr:hypothetical protein [Lachnospiraceae bacterium]